MKENKTKQDGFVLRDGTFVKFYRLTDPEFKRMCGLELTDREFTEANISSNGWEVINNKTNGGKNNED